MEKQRGAAAVCVSELVQTRMCEVLHGPTGAIDKQPLALICGGSSSLDQLSWGLILFCVLLANKVCFLYLFDLLSRLWVAHPAGMGFDFIMFVPL